MKYSTNIYISSRCLGLHQWLIIMKYSINIYVSSRCLGLHKWVILINRRLDARLLYTM